MGPNSSPPNFESFWDDLRPDSERRPSQRAKAVRALSQWEPPSLERIENWVEALHSGQKNLLAIDGPSASLRNEVYRWCYLGDTLGCDLGNGGATRWLTEGAFTNFTHRVSRCDQDRPWGLLWQLLHSTEFTVADPLYALVDKGSCFTEFFKAIWEARFLLAEKPQDVNDLFEALPKWMLGQTLSPTDQEALDRAHITRELESQAEQTEMMFFLLALAHQNGIIERTVFVFDGLDRVLHQLPAFRRGLFNELYELAGMAERWAKLGSTTGFVLGFSSEQSFNRALEDEHPKLAKLVHSSLV
jgi:hypothetical protein